MTQLESSIARPSTVSDIGKPGQDLQVHFSEEKPQSAVPGPGARQVLGVVCSSDQKGERRVSFEDWRSEGSCSTSGFHHIGHMSLAVRPLRTWRLRRPGLESL